MRRKTNTDLFSTFDKPSCRHDLGKVLTELVDFMDIAIWELDDAYRIIACNQKALITYGDDIIGQLCHSVTMDSNSVCFGCPVKQVYRSHKSHRGLQPSPDIKGNKLFVEQFATPIFAANGTLSGVLVLLVDITEHKNREDKLRRHKIMLENITSRKKAELAKSEGKFAVAFDASPDAININRLEDGLYIEVNKGFTKLTGFTVEDVIGKTSQEIDIWNDLADRQRLIKHLQKDGYCENLEARFKRKDGSLTTALMSARVITLNDRPHIISITRDIGKFRELESEIAAQQQLFETMFNAIEDGIVITNTEREIRLANDGMSKTFGYSRQELVGVTTKKLYADEQGYLQAGKSIFNAAVRPGNFQYERVYKHKSGRVFPAATFAAKLFDREGQWLGNLGIMRDITEQRNTEADRDKLIAAVQQTGESIVITDSQGIIEFVNPAFTEITGYTSKEAIGKNPKILQSGKHDALFYQEMWDTISSGKTFHGKIINKRKDGRLYTEEATISPITSAQGKIVNYVAVKRDITQQIATEQQLQQAQKMEAIGRLTGGVAHDFNNMLSVIIGYTEMALEKLPAREEVQSNLETILDAAERSAAIVRQLLAFSRRQIIVPQNLDLNSMIEGMLKMLRRLIGENIELDWVPCPMSLPVKFDPSQMDQILANLCVNAKDAIENNGTITLETGVVAFDELYCSEHLGFRAGEFVMLVVSDDGIGIAKEDLGRVYEPFFTTKELGRGTGLGLSTVYGIVKQNNGFINIYSEPGLGTTIKVYLPFCHEEQEEKGPYQKQHKSVTGHETILLVEDDLNIREMASMMLSNLGYTVFPVATPRRALELVREENHQFHLLLTDVVMPDMNGKELAKQLQDLIPDLKCLYMSGYTANVIAKKGILGKDLHFIQKPFSKNDLAKQVREILDDFDRAKTCH